MKYKKIHQEKEKIRKALINYIQLNNQNYLKVEILKMKQG